MTNQEREGQRKLKVLHHAEKSGHVARTCRYFGVGRSSFYRWKAAYERHGEDGLVNAKPIPRRIQRKNPLRSVPRTPTVIKPTVPPIVDLTRIAEVE